MENKGTSTLLSYTGIVCYCSVNSVYLLYIIERLIHGSKIEGFHTFKFIFISLENSSITG